MRQIKWGLLALVAVWLMGCVSSPERAPVPVVDAGSEAPGGYDDTSVTAPSYPDREYVPAETAPRAENTAVVALLDVADRQTRSGDYGSAAASLERAIRISPRDGRLYFQLAQVRYLQENFHQTEQLCRKAISLAAGDSRLIADSRSLMAQAQQAARAN